MKSDGPQLFLRCEWDQTLFEYNGGKRRRYCSDACKQAAWRQKREDTRGYLSVKELSNLRELVGSHVCDDDEIRKWPASGPCPHCGRSPA